MPRKSISKLDAHAKVLDQWLSKPEEGGENMALIPACARLKAEHGCSVSAGTLSVWWSKRQRNKSVANLRESIVTGRKAIDDVENDFATNPPPTLDLLIRWLRVTIFNLATSGNVSAEELKLICETIKPVMEFAKLEQKQNEFGLDREKFELLKRRAEQAEQAEGLSKSSLTPEEQAQRLREIFQR